jgi:hypothetical protein
MGFHVATEKLVRIFFSGAETIQKEKKHSMVYLSHVIAWLHLSLCYDYAVNCR